MSSLFRTQTLIVASAFSAPDDKISLPLIPFISAQMVAPSCQFSLIWPEGNRDVKKF